MRRDASFQPWKVAASVALPMLSAGRRAFYNCQAPTRVVRINFKCPFLLWQLNLPSFKSPPDVFMLPGARFDPNLITFNDAADTKYSPALPR